MVLVMDINRVLDCAAVSAASVIGGKRTPADDFLILYGHCDRVFWAVVGEPVLAVLKRFWLFLVSASGVENVMIVNVVDDFEIGFRGWTDCDGIAIAFRKFFGSFYNRAAFGQQGHNFGVRFPTNVLLTQERR